MKKFTVTVLLLLACLVASTCADAAWRVVLKNGGEFTTLRYWKEGGEVRWYIRGMVVGVKHYAVRKIEQTPWEYVAFETPRPKKEDVPAVAKETPPPPQGQVDIKAYRKKKEQLGGALELAMSRVHAATKKGDHKAKERAQREVKKISAEIYDLTDEVKKANKGSLPEDWWEKKH